MNKIIIACGLVGILGLLVIGCGGNACEAAADDYVAHYESCGNTLPEASGSAAETTCTDQQGKDAQCASDCYVATSCDYVNGKGTAEEATEYTTCLADCAK